MFFKLRSQVRYNKDMVERYIPQQEADQDPLNENVIKVHMKNGNVFKEVYPSAGERDADLLNLDAIMGMATA